MKKRKISIEFNSPVVISFALLSLIVLLIEGIPGISITERYFAVYRAPLTDVFTYFRMFSHVLGHASFSHYINNMLLILVLGPNLEERYGSKRLLSSILITAFLTGIVNIIFCPNTALMGASGIVFMMIVMSSFAGAREGNIPLTTIVVFGLYIGNEIIDLVAVSDSISQLAHITGGVCGAFFGFLYANKGKHKY